MMESLKVVHSESSHGLRPDSGKHPGSQLEAGQRAIGLGVRQCLKRNPRSGFELERGRHRRRRRRRRRLPGHLESTTTTTAPTAPA